MNKTLEYQLGYYVGEYIYHCILPTLSIDGILSRKVFYVSAKEGDTFRKLESDWFKATQTKSGKTLDECNMLWNEMTVMQHTLAKKYLPDPLECFVPKIQYTKGFNELDFNDGIRLALWNTDVCWYKIEKNEDIVIENEEKWHTIIKLQLDVNS